MESRIFRLEPALQVNALGCRVLPIEDGIVIYGPTSRDSFTGCFLIKVDLQDYTFEGASFLRMRAADDQGNGVPVLCPNADGFALYYGRQHSNTLFMLTNRLSLYWTAYFQDVPFSIVPVELSQSDDTLTLGANVKSDSYELGYGSIAIDSSKTHFTDAEAIYSIDKVGCTSRESDPTIVAMLPMKNQPLILSDRTMELENHRLFPWNAQWAGNAWVQLHTLWRIGSFLLRATVADDVPLLSAAKPDAPVKGRIDEETKVSIIDATNHRLERGIDVDYWYKVRISNGMVGWVSGQYLKFEYDYGE